MNRLYYLNTFMACILFITGVVLLWTKGTGLIFVNEAEFYTWLATITTLFIANTVCAVIGYYKEY